MVDTIHYAELTPNEFRERIAAAPIAYLPLGTLEWHGEHPSGQHTAQQLPGSAYWASDETFGIIMEAVLSNLSRAGFRIVVGHGHGPSTAYFRDHADEWREKFGLECICCWNPEKHNDPLGIQTDHAAANETSLMMAIRPDLVHMENLPAGRDQWPLAIAGDDPREHASADRGRKAIDTQTDRMADLLQEALNSL